MYYVETVPATSLLSEQASLLPGRFQCGRVAIAGLAPYAQADPLLVVASEGDNVVRLPRVIAALPDKIQVQEWVIAQSR